MSKTHIRIEDGKAELITVQEALAEMSDCQMGGWKKVREMSASGSSAAIEYKDGRKVILRPATEDERAAETEAVEWSGTASNGCHVHRFSADLKALCNSRIRSRGCGTKEGVLVGHDALRTRSAILSSEHADLYTFCPKCEER